MENFKHNPEDTIDIENYKVLQSRGVYSFTRFICKCLVRIFLKSKVCGLSNVPKDKPFILCSNHVSNWDPILLIAVQPRKIFFMGKEELFKNKIVGTFLRKVGVFPVKRGKGDKTAIYNAQSIINDAGVLGLFIEGTRSKTGEFLRPKSGAGLIAMSSHADVVPVCITYNKSLFRKRAVVSFGKTILFDDIQVSDNTGKEIRKLSSMFMDKIKELR